MFISILLIIIGIVFLLKNLGFISVGTWGIVWPSILIALGVYLLVRTLYHQRKYPSIWKILQP